MKLKRDTQLETEKGVFVPETIPTRGNMKNWNWSSTITAIAVSM